MRKILSIPVRLVAAIIALAGVAILAAALIRFSGALSLVEPLSTFAYQVETILPAIPSIHTLTTPMGGVLRADFLVYAVILICGHWVVSRIADAIAGD